MKSDLHRRASEIYLDANELPPESRRVHVEGVCKGDAELLQEVLSLLEHTDEKDEFLESPALGEPLDLSMTAEKDELPFDEIGPYRLIERIGAGGFGIVYLAEQSQPVRRRVALKLIKPGMDSEEVLARFEAEKQALSRMDHPGVASVLDAGVTTAGRPYFVMEYVAGDQIVAYCDRARLDVSDRLKLFVRVCEAVQHAHQKGIIHRDLKPSNILVSLRDGLPVPKVIDFGVAKALVEPLVGGELHTLRGKLIGTPEYMSPEQAETSGLDVDTRTDIYSLGVLLYELLSGTLPISRPTDSSNLAMLMLKVIEEEPPSPSQRVSAENSDRVAERRRTTPDRLSRRLAGDLDWITLMALEKDRLRRYASASELAADVERSSRDEPVVAGPPSASYRVRKFVTRNRLAVLAAGAILLAMLVSIISISQAMLETGRERDRAREAERLADHRLREVEVTKNDLRDQRDRALEAEFLAGQRLVEVRQAQEEAIVERERAEVEAAEAAAVTDFLKTMWSFAKPVAGRSYDITALELLDAASRTLDSSLSNNPKLRSTLHTTLGRIYLDLRQLDAAERETRAALRLGETDVNERGQRLAMLKEHVVGVLAAQARWEEAKPLMDESMAELREEFGEDHIQLASGYHLLARYYHHQGEAAKMLDASRRALEITRREFGDTNERTLYMMIGLGHFLGETGQLEEAHELLSLAYEGRREQLGPDDPSTISTLSLLAHLWHQMQRHEDAAEAMAEILAAHEVMFGPDNLRTAQSTNNLATQYVLLGDLESAVPMLRQALSIFEVEYPEGHPMTITVLQNIAKALGETGRVTEALEASEHAVSMTSEFLPPRHALQGFTRSTLGEHLLQVERFEEAEQVLSEAYPLMAAARGARDSNVILTMRRLARAHAGLGDEVAAAEWRRRADDIDVP